MTVPSSANVFNPAESPTLVVRPEMMEIETSDVGVQGVVRRAAYLGNIIEYDVEVSGQVLALVEHDPRHHTVHPEGTTVGVRFLEDCLYVLRKKE